MFRTQSIAAPADDATMVLKRRIWKDRTLVKTHAVVFAFGITSVLWVQHYSTPIASAATNGSTTATTSLAASQSAVPNH